MSITRLSIVAVLALAGCASQNGSIFGGGPTTHGRHLVYRDSAGVAFRQFDYPDESFCHRVEAMVGRDARCQPEPATGLVAHATLRYNPPGVLVEGHYRDMARCRTDTSAMAAGVELVNRCSER